MVLMATFGRTRESHALQHADLSRSEPVVMRETPVCTPMETEPIPSSHSPLGLDSMYRHLNYRDPQDEASCFEIKQQQESSPAQEALDVAAAARFKLLLDQNDTEEVAEPPSPKKSKIERLSFETQQTHSVESSPNMNKRRLTRTRDSQAVMRTKKIPRPPPLQLDPASVGPSEFPVALLPVRTSSRRAMHDCAILGLDSQLHLRNALSPLEYAGKGTISTFSLRLSSASTPLYSPLPQVFLSPVPPVPSVPHVIARSRSTPSSPDRGSSHQEHDYQEDASHWTESTTTHPINEVQQPYTQPDEYMIANRTSDTIRRTLSAGSMTSKKLSADYTEFTTWVEEVAALYRPSCPSSSPSPLPAMLIEPEEPVSASPDILHQPIMQQPQARQSTVTTATTIATNPDSTTARPKALARSVCFSPSGSSPSSSYSSSSSYSTSTPPPDLTFVPSSPSPASSPTMTTTPHISGSSTKSTRHHPRKRTSLFGWFRPRGRFRMTRAKNKKGVSATDVDDLIDLYFRDDGSVLSERGDDEYNSVGDENDSHHHHFDAERQDTEQEPEQAQTDHNIALNEAVQVGPAVLRSQNGTTRKKMLGFF